MSCVAGLAVGLLDVGVGDGAVELVALADLARDGQANQVTRPSRGLEREEESGIEPLT
jgi:hypothetical protein